jgi:hypothetical protein
VLVNIPLNIPAAPAAAAAAAATTTVATQQQQKGQHNKRPNPGQVSSSSPSILAPALKAACSERRSRRQAPKKSFGEDFFSC